MARHWTKQAKDLLLAALAFKEGQVYPNQSKRRPTEVVLMSNEYSTPRQCKICGVMIQLQFKGKRTFVVDAAEKGQHHSRHKCAGWGYKK